VVPAQDASRAFVFDICLMAIAMQFLSPKRHDVRSLVRWISFRKD